MPKLIRNTYAGWVSSNPVLALEDTGFERDTGRSKIGDGVKAWNALNYFNEAPAGGGIGSPLQIYQRSDDFSSVDMSKWVADTGALPASGTGFAVPTGAYFMHLLELSPTNVHLVGKFVPKHLDNALAVSARSKAHDAHGVDNKPRIQVQHHAGTFIIYYYDGVAYTSLVSNNNVARTPVDIPEWVTCKCEGSRVVGEVWQTDPSAGGAPFASLTTMLTDAQMNTLDRTFSFTGVNLSGTGPNAYVDHFNVIEIPTLVRSPNGTKYYWGVNDDGQVATIPV